MSNLILDCNNLSHIAWHAMPALTSYEKPTSVLFGFLKYILKAQDRFRKDKLIFCWDSRQSYRKIIYPDYKANRIKKDMTDEEKEDKKIMFAQFDELRKEILPKLGFTNIFRQTGYEADDLIAHIVKEHPTEEHVVISTDQDLYQLLYNSRTVISNPLTGKGLTSSLFRKKYNIDPNNWGLVKAYAGCTTDNVIGIKGVGETTAIKYINGELPHTHKTYQKMSSPEGQKLKRKNKRLVCLPFMNVKKIELELQEQPQLVKKDFMDVFDDLMFDSFLSDFKEWVFAFGLE